MHFIFCQIWGGGDPQGQLSRSFPSAEWEWERLRWECSVEEELSALDFDELKNISMCDSKTFESSRETEKCWYTSILIQM